MLEASLDSSHELGDLREELPFKKFTAQIAGDRPIPTSMSSVPNTIHVTGPAPSVSQMQHEGEEFDALGHSDLLEDAKFYQDTVVKSQSAYYSIQDKYTHQAHLQEEASRALWVTESQASQMQQELLALKRCCDADIQQAVSRVVSQYQMQLNTDQTCTHDHQLTIKQLQDQVHTLQLSLASRADLPSVGKFQGEVDLWEEVFNILPGTINATWGATIYHLPDQAFSFQKQVWFGERPNQADLKLDTDLGKQVPPLSSHNVPHSSTPYHSGAIPMNLLNHTFDVSGISVLIGNPQDAATVVAEVSAAAAAAAAQASKEFWHMWEPKITKLRGRYSADTELVFWSWWVDILSHIQDCELDNKAAIQLIKEQTLENVQHEVDFQLNLCSDDIMYQDLLKHLRIAFQRGNDEANLLVEF